MTLQTPIHQHDHTQGAADAPIILVQYGDFECPFSGAAYPAVQEVRARLGERLLYVFRQFPLYDIHPHALRAAEAAEAAGAQGAFWPMYDLLFENQRRLDDASLVRYAESIGLDMDRFVDELNTRTHVQRIKESIEGGRVSGAHGTPTFFINGRFFDNREGLWDVEVLLEAIEQAS